MHKPEGDRVQTGHVCVDWTQDRGVVTMTEHSTKLVCGWHSSSGINRAHMTPLAMPVLFFNKQENVRMYFLLFTL